MQNVCGEVQKCMCGGDGRGVSSFERDTCIGVHSTLIFKAISIYTYVLPALKIKVKTPLQIPDRARDVAAKWSRSTGARDVPSSQTSMLVLSPLAPSNVLALAQSENDHEY